MIVEGPPAGVGYPEWLGTQLAAGEPAKVRPDIVSGNYQATYANYVNLDKYVFQTNPYTGHIWNEDVDWSFWQERNARGERIMLPTEAVHILWFYNQELFDKAGVEPPTTWDELVSACAKIEEATPEIKCAGANYVWKLNQWILEIYWDQYARDIVEIARCQAGDYCYDEEVDGKFMFDPNDADDRGQVQQELLALLRRHSRRQDQVRHARDGRHGAQPGQDLPASTRRPRCSWTRMSTRSSCSSRWR